MGLSKRLGRTIEVGMVALLAGCSSAASSVAPLTPAAEPSAAVLGTPPDHGTTEAARGRAPTAPIQFVSRSGSGVSASESEIEDRLGTIEMRLDALGSGVMDFWKAHGPDRKYGGIHGFHDRKGQPREEAPKGLVQQARHLWSFSTWYARREHSAPIKAVADSTYQFLIAHFLDHDGEFFYQVSRDGSKVVEPKKQLYAESFAILGLATYGRIFGVPDAIQKALACFTSIDQRMHDAQYLGYDETNDPGWLAPGAQKDTNTHIHLLEAFTELYRASKDATVRSRVDELVKVVAARIVQPSNYAHKEFYRDWRVHARPVVSYGHDLETAWLLIDALDALGTANDAVKQVALQLGKNSAEFGYDEAKGGYFEEGPPGGAPTQLEKVWWVQAEALPSLWWLYRLSNDAHYLTRLEGTLSWIETKQQDSEYGEWFWGINPDGSVSSRGDQKGEEWKAEYHSLRAIMFTADWINEALAKGSWAPTKKGPAKSMGPAARAPVHGSAGYGVRAAQGLDSMARR
jgi:mannobiose 2-epimerase